jgi:C-terminal processing protease CtpA/Prc
MMPHTFENTTLSAITKLKKQGMQQLILDLTDNGGGYMQIAAQIANEMLNRGNLIVYTQGRKSPRQNLNADGSGTFRTQKVVVMINQFSASASEILSGAVQDRDTLIRQIAGIHNVCSAISCKCSPYEEEGQDVSTFLCRASRNR